MPQEAEQSTTPFSVRRERGRSSSASLGKEKCAEELFILLAPCPVCLFHSYYQEDSAIFVPLHSAVRDRAIYCGLYSHLRFIRTL
jgi:hypothetical protein